MLLHLLLKNDKELFDKVIVREVEKKKSKLHISLSIYVD